MKERVIPFSPPDISDAEIKEVVNTMNSGWITTGPRTKLLERRLAAFIETGCTDVDCISEEAINKYSNRVVCLSSATVAEELNLRLVGVRDGDEVIVPAYTYTASASAAIHCGAKVVFVDIQKDGDVITHAPEMDYEKLEQVITPRTKAIVLVDIGGVVCDYERVLQIIEKKKNLFSPIEPDGTVLGDINSRIQHELGRIAVIADCAHSLGASRLINGKWVYSGSIADFSSFSFHAVKNLTTAEGGASTWKRIGKIDDTEIYRMYQLLSLHGQNKDALTKTQIGAWEYDIVGPWYKCNMTDIMASMGLRQLDRYLGLIARRGEIVKWYDEMCAEIGIYQLRHQTEGVESAKHLYITRIPNISEDKRNEMIKLLAESGIMTNVHYKPLPMMTAYRSMGWNISDFPNAYDYYHNLISLPLHTLLSNEDVNYVCDGFKRIVQKFI